MWSEGGVTEEKKIYFYYMTLCVEIFPVPDPRILGRQD